MNTQSILSGRLGARCTAPGAAILVALCATVPVGAIADQDTTTSTASRVADVSLSDLNLSAPDGMRVARDRLYTVAERLCADRADRGEPSAQRAVSVCVDSTVNNALRQIGALRQADTTVRNSVTLGANVSLADLDLATLEGAHVARERLEAMARRLCGELARRPNLSYQLNYAACVHDSLAGALVQADALAAARVTRVARRGAP